ncbi:MAG: PilZ domain-containing protein [Candidatus Sulfotelmatobacter sp.]
MNGQSMNGLSMNGYGVDRRREPRSSADLPLLVWGVDTRGERFLQEARVRDLSLSGALLSGLDSELRSGDVIGILYAGKKARYRVIWVRHSGSEQKAQAAVHRFTPDECPWKELLAEEPAGDPPATRHSPEATLGD